MPSNSSRLRSARVKRLFSGGGSTPGSARLRNGLAGSLAPDASATVPQTAATTQGATGMSCMPKVLTCGELRPLPQVLRPAWLPTLALNTWPVITSMGPKRAAMSASRAVRLGPSV
ncbi:hypothetical protein D3C84_947560 [compost metagenome]